MADQPSVVSTSDVHTKVVSAISDLQRIARDFRTEFALASMQADEPRQTSAYASAVADSISAHGGATT